MRQPRLLLLATIAVVAVVAAKPMPEEFSYQFRKGVADPALRLTGPSAKQVAKPDDRGLRITLSSQRTNKSAIAVNPNFAMRGDCEVTLTFDLLSTEDPLSEQMGAGIVLTVKVAGSERRAVALSRLRRPGKGGQGTVDTFGASLITRENGKEKYDTKKVPATDNSGRLRLERHGEVVKVSVADGADGEFQLIREITVGKADLHALSFQCRATSGGVDARFVDLTVRAESLIDEAAVTSPPSFPRWLPWVLGVVALVGVVGWFLRYRAQGKRSLPPHLAGGEPPPVEPARKTDNGPVDALRARAGTSSQQPTAPAAPVRRHVIVAILATLALGALVGGLVWWGRAAAGDVTVRGRVTVDGEPLSGGLVIFYPDAAQGNHSPVEPRGRTDRQGGYLLQAEGQKGIAPGWYRVVVVPWQADPGEKNVTPTPKNPTRFERRYEKPDTSGLVVLVSPNPARGAYDLQLARQRPGK